MSARRIGAVATASLLASMLLGLPATASPVIESSARAAELGAAEHAAPEQREDAGGAYVLVEGSAVEPPLVVSDLGYAARPEPAASPGASILVRQAVLPTSAARMSEAAPASPVRERATGSAASSARAATRQARSDARQAIRDVRARVAGRSHWRPALFHPADAPSPHGDDLVAAALPETPVAAGAALSPEALAAAVVRAQADWALAVGEAPAVSATIADLPGRALGQTTGSSIVIDVDAAGWGWSRMDLLTVVRHEIGHALGHEHADSGLMTATLEPGEIRAVPTAPVTHVAPAAPAPAAEDAGEPAPAARELEARSAEAPDRSDEPGAAVEPSAGPAAYAPAADAPAADAPAAASESAPDASAAAPATDSAAPEADPGSVELAAGSVTLSSASPAERVPVSLSWIVTGGEATLDVGDATATSIVSYDAAHDVLRLEIDDASADLPASGLVRVVIVSRAGTVTLTGQIRLTATGLLVKARHVVVESGASIDTRGETGNGSITLEAIAEDRDEAMPATTPQPATEAGAGEPGAAPQGGPAAAVEKETAPAVDPTGVEPASDPSGVEPAPTPVAVPQPRAQAANSVADASVSVSGASLKGGDITISARSSAGGAAEANRADVAATARASVAVVDSEIVSSGDVTLLAESAASGRATASGDVAHADSARDAASASVRLVSSATATLGGQSTVAADGVLSVLARNTTDARSWGDASGSAAGAGIATASVDRVTIAAIDGAGEGGIVALRLDVSADSDGTMSVRSASSTGGATQNDAPPTERALSLARTPDSFVNVASALGEGRLNGQTHSYLASGAGRSLTVSTTEAQRVTARTTDSTDVVADSSASGSGAAVAVALRTLEARADLEGNVVLVAPVVVLDAGLERTASRTSAVGASTGAVAIEVARSVTEAGLLAGSTLDVGGEDQTAGSGNNVTVRASSATTDLASARRADQGSAVLGSAAEDAATAPPVGSDRVVLISDTRTRAFIADGADLRGAADLTLSATSDDSATADAGPADGQGAALVVLTATTTSSLGSGEALVLDGDLTVLADQLAVATALGAEAVVTLTQDHRVLVGREVTTGGRVALLVNGAPIEVLADGAVAVVDGPVMAGFAVVGGSVGVEPAGATGLIAPVTPSAGIASAAEPGRSGAPGGGGPGSVPFEGVVVNAGSTSAGGAHRDGPAAPAPAFAVQVALVANRVRLSVPAALRGDLRLRSGRGPPRVRRCPAARGTTTVPAESAAPRTIAVTIGDCGAHQSPVARVGVIDALTGLFEADHSAQSQALQPPADSVLTFPFFAGLVGASNAAPAPDRHAILPVGHGKCAARRTSACRSGRAGASRADRGAARAAVVDRAGAPCLPALDLVERGTAVMAVSVVRGAAIWGVGGAAGSGGLGFVGLSSVGVAACGSRPAGVVAGGLGSRVGRGVGGSRRGAGAAAVFSGGMKTAAAPLVVERVCT